MLTRPMIHQFRLPVQWQPLLQPRHLPLPCSNGHRVVEAEAEEVGVTEAEEGVAEEAAEEEAAEEEVHLVGNLLPHLQPQRQLHLTTEED